MEVPSGFQVRTVSVGGGVTRIYDETEWRDALVVVTRGEIELESTRGDSVRLGRGCVLCLAGLPLRALHGRGAEPAVLVAISRR